MEDFRFGEISLWWLILIAPFFYAYLRFSRAKLLKDLYQFIDESLLPKLSDSFQLENIKKYRRNIFIVISIFLITLSLLRPQWGFTHKKSNKKGVDIVFAIDVSNSMLAKDVTPNRLIRAKREIIDFLKKLKGDRVALVTFAGSAFLEAPLTLDYSAFRLFLDSIDTDLIPIQGTNINAALETSVNMFEKKEEQNTREKALLLITDGEDFEGDFSDIAAKAKEQGIQIYIIGVGTEKGGPIPTRRRGYKRDKSGEIIISKLNEQALMQLATDTGGKYALSINSDADAYSLYDKGIKQNLRASSLKGAKTKKWNEYYQFPLFFGVIFLLLAWQSKPFFVLIALTTLSFNPLIAKAQDDSKIEKYGLEAKKAFEDGEFEKAIENFKLGLEKNKKDHRLNMGLGSSYYRTNKFKEAAKTFLESALSTNNQKQKAEALFNAGNSLVQSGDYEGAVKAYEQALKSNANDKDSKKNLQYAKKLIEQQQQQQQQQQQDSDSKDQQQEKNQDQQKKEQQKNEQQEKDSKEQQENDQEKNEQQQKDQQEESQGQKEENEVDDQEKDSKEQNSNSSEDETEKEESEDSKQKKEEQRKAIEEKLENQEENKKQAPKGEQKQNTDNFEQPKERSDQLESQLGNIEESNSRRMKYRMRKGIQQLRRLRQRTPEKDW